MFTLGRQREKEHAARYVRTEADQLVVERVVDAAHDLMEGIASAEVVAVVFTEAFITGGGGAWEQTGAWLRKLAGVHPLLDQVWMQLAPHKAVRIRFRVAAFLNDMPDAVRLQLAATFLGDSSAKVRAKTAGEISMRPTPELQPLLQNRLNQEKDTEVINALQQALAAYSTGSA